MTKRKYKLSGRLLAVAMILAMAASLIPLIPFGLAEEGDETATLEIRKELFDDVTDGAYYDKLFIFRVEPYSTYYPTGFDLTGYTIDMKYDYEYWNEVWNVYVDEYGSWLCQGLVQVRPNTTVRISGLEPGQYIVEEVGYIDFIDENYDLVPISNFNVYGYSGYPWEDQVEETASICPAGICE